MFVRDKQNERMLIMRQRRRRTVDNNKRDVSPRVASAVEIFLLLMKPLGKTSLLFVLCSSSSLSRDHHFLNLPVSCKQYMDK